MVRELEKQRRMSGRANSASPPPTSGPETPKVGSPLPIAPESDDLLNDRDIIRFMNETPGQVTVKQVVGSMKAFLAKNASNKDRLRKIMKKVLNHDKESGIVTLKDEYVK